MKQFRQQSAHRRNANFGLLAGVFRVEMPSQKVLPVG